MQQSWKNEYLKIRQMNWQLERKFIRISWLVDKNLKNVNTQHFELDGFFFVCVWIYADRVEFLLEISKESDFFSSSVSSIFYKAIDWWRNWNTL